MFGKVLTSCVLGIDGQIIEVEVDINPGLPSIQIVGLPDSAVRESIERVRAAIKNCEFQFPTQRITVNLAPADLRKEGSIFDLSIAAGILKASGQINWEPINKYLLIGELSLDGLIRPVPGVLSMVQAAKQSGIESVILPADNLIEAELIDGIKLIPIQHLHELSDALCDEVSLWPTHESKPRNFINNVNNKQYKIYTSVPFDGVTKFSGELFDFSDVKGHYHAKRALMIAASGLHNILFIGPPGSGKTMLMRRLPTIMPDLSTDESIEVMKIYSVANQTSNRTKAMKRRPFRSPHHTISSSGLIGGGSIPKPGEVSLSHLGVLFLDELPEFNRNVLEVMRQPLEDHQVTISRARAAYTYPSQFMLTASMNPCPCGYYGYDTAQQTCTCSPIKIKQYRSKISGPLLDRIDLQVEVASIDVNAYQSTETPLSSDEMKKQVHEAHTMQSQRYSDVPFSFNSELHGKWIRKFCELEFDAAKLMKQSFASLGFSMRAHDRILKIARTIADLDQSDSIKTEHLAEAIQYRSLDRITP